MNIKVPKELVELTDLSMLALEKQNVLLLVFELYFQGKISLSRAAELVNLKVDVFIGEYRKRRLLRRGGPQTSTEAENELSTVTEFFS